jgi:branched-chain amino acid transport system substrate-binding protein
VASRRGGERAGGLAVERVLRERVPTRVTHEREVRRREQLSEADDTLAAHIRKSAFKTVLGDIRFGKFGEWAESRVLQVQFRGIKNNDPAQFKGIETQTVVDPAAYESGSLIYPYEKAR